MRIIFLSTRFPPRFSGGAEIYAALLAEALSQKGHKVLVFTQGEKKQRREKEFVVREIRELIPSPYLATLMLSGWTKRVQGKIKKTIEGADIVHVFDLESVLALAGWQEVKDKLVATIQDYGFLCPDGRLLREDGKVCSGCNFKNRLFCLGIREANFLKKIYFQLAFPYRLGERKKIFSHLRYPVFVSQYVARRVKGRSNTSEVIYNPLPVEWTKDRLEEKGAGVLFVGRVEKYKGIEVLLGAMRKVLKKIDTSLTVVGGGEINFYQKMAYSLGIDDKVKFVGPVPFEKIESFYSKVRLVAAPALWPEPCGRTIIEGMAKGKVVIGSNHGGTPELIQNEKTGFLVPPGDEEMLAKTIIKVLSEESFQRKIGASAYRYAWENFNPALIARKYEEVYRKIKEQR